MKRSRILRLVLVGAPLDTGNLGVSALCLSVLESLCQRIPNVQFSIFDHGRGVRPLQLGYCKDEIHAELCGATQTRRVYRPESYSRVRLACRYGGLFNPAAKKILAADAIMDISGGDSFTDLYGPWRFRQVSIPKMIAIEAKRPLFLLPQTYGPFKESQTRQKASLIVRNAQVCWARDERSFQVLKNLLGGDFDPERHRLGVDVAFLLQPKKAKTSGELEEFFSRGGTRDIVGFNISGLIWNQPRQARLQYAFVADYRRVVLDLLDRVVRAGANVVLTPHVMAPVGHFESDIQACREVMDQLAAQGLEKHVMNAPAIDDPREAKWIIAQCDWFCGTRMHATIAGLSSGVPTAAIAYSDKTLGVFETCGQGEHVADPRKLDTQDMIEHLWTSWESRRQCKADLALQLPGVLSQAQTQMDVIAEYCDSCVSPREATLR